MQLWDSMGVRNPSKVVSDFMHHIQLDNAYIGIQFARALTKHIGYIVFIFVGHEVVLVKNGGRICGTGGALATAPLVQSKSYFEVKIQQGGQWSVGLATRKVDLNRAHGGHDAESWCLGSDHLVVHDGRELHSLAPALPPQVQRPVVEVDGDASATISNHIGIASDVQRLVDDTAVETEQPHRQRVAAAPTTVAVDGAAGDGVPAEGDTLGVAYDHVELNFYLNGKKLDVPVLNVRGTVYPALFGMYERVGLLSIFFFNMSTI